MIRIVPLLLCALAAPAHAGTLQVVGSLVREATLAAGQSSEGTFLVRNTSDAPLRVQVAQRDYTFQADGSNQFGEPGSVARSNAAWVSFAPAELVLPPGGSSEVAYVMTAPDVSVAAGTYWSALLVEPVADPEEMLARGVHVRTVIRYAIQLVTEVAGDAEATLQFDAVDLRRDAEGNTLFVALSNPGARALVPSLNAQVHGSDGASSTFDGGRARIYPGCSVTVRIPLTGLAAGQYEALVVADAGLDTLFGARTALDLRAPVDDRRASAE